jgi:UDP-MurNAc hydroxylase
MKIEFVNHASFILENKDIRLICDPWIEGTAFDNGWKLLSKTKFTYDDFKDITHIWFSHEHPDHFSPPNLSRIPKEYRERIKVLYQDTIDHKVVDFCRKIGFKELIELPANKFYQIGEGFKIKCNPYSDGDSYLLFQVEGVKILNLNDCLVNTTEKAKDIYEKTGEVDVLLTQFGYANKVGDADDVALREQASKEKLDRIRIQVDVLKPKHVIPFASFVYFCHEENKYMNEGMNRIDTVDNFIKDSLHVQSVVLYPGDAWIVGEKWNSEASVQRYLNDYRALKDAEYVKSSSVDEQELMKNAASFLNKLKKGYPWRKGKVKGIVARFYVSDLNKVFEFSGSRGLYPIDAEVDTCNIAITSSALNYCFRELWGFDTLDINGRSQAIKDYHKVRRLSNIAGSLNRKEPFPEPGIGKRVLLRLNRIIQR